jgi:hypothetical protein
MDDIKKIITHFCPENTDENPAFPNFTDTDIWENGFLVGIAVATKAITHEYSIKTKNWIFNKIINKFDIK